MCPNPMPSPSRALVVRFLWKDSVLAWQCSACGKLFSVGIEEAESRPTFIPTAAVWTAYDAHVCFPRLFTEPDPDPPKVEEVTFDVLRDRFRRR